MTCATAGGRFLLDRANNGHMPTGEHIDGSRSSRKGAQGTFGVDSPPPIEPIILPTHLQFAGEGVDMAQQHNLMWPVAPGADGVADRIHTGIEAVGGHPAYQMGRSFSLMARWAGDRDQIL